MGDRGNITIRQWNSEDRVYLYTHWGGSEIGSTLQNALKRQWRWSDPAYLARIIFDEMTGDDHGQEGGFGIATSAPDNEHLVLDVDCQTQTVNVRNLSDKAGLLGPVEHWSFRDFIRLGDIDEIIAKLEND